jgi:hypothetical protein
MSTASKIRNYVRVRLPRGTLVAWEHMGERKVSPVSVMGLGGLFISTPEPPPAGDFIKLVFELPGGDVRARARICDSRSGKGMGIQFVSMGHEARARLNRYVDILIRK